MVKGWTALMLAGLRGGQAVSVNVQRPRSVTGRGLRSLAWPSGCLAKRLAVPQCHDPLLTLSSCPLTRPSAAHFTATERSVEGWLGAFIMGGSLDVLCAVN